MTGAGSEQHPEPTTVGENVTESGKSGMPRAEVKADDVRYEVVVPHHATDYIQGSLMSTGVPYELDMLQAMARVLRPGDTVLDVGANIGNHTLYLAAVVGCRVLSFEPNAELTAALRESVEVDGLQDRVTVVQAAVGSTSARGTFREARPDNLGAQQVELEDTGGEFDVVVLDEVVDLPRIDAIKIDVEGMEPDVLAGATELVRRDRPHLFVECQDLEAFESVVGWMCEHHYEYRATYNATPTHHFVPGDESRAALAGVGFDLVRERYRLLDELRRVRQARDAANRRYREVSGSRALSNAEQAYARVHGEAVRYRAERDHARRMIDTLRRRAAKSDKRARAQRRELRAVRRELRAVRRSATYRAGRLVADALRNPSSLPLLPVRLVRLALRRRAQTRRPVPAADPRPSAAGQQPSAPLAPPLSQVRPARSPGREKSVQLGRQTLAGSLAADRPTRVAAIVDDFTRSGLGAQCDLLDLHPATWEEELESFRPDLLFVESAWRGAGGAWHNSVPANPEALRGIIDWCNAHGVPTVFWNKEDPVHFETFIHVAREFDHVVTTDLDCVDQYRVLLGHDRVSFLPFAAQPQVQNPIETTERKEALVFAGGYYVRYKERMRDLKAILGGALQVMPVEIFDRNYGTTLEEYAFPAEFSKHVVGTLRPQELDVAYKGYRFALNLNSVKSSQTMFARRVYELVASNTLTISNYAKGLSVVFGDLVPMTDSEPGTAALLRELQADPDRTDRMRAIALRKVLREHTYGERLRYLLALCSGTAYEPSTPTVTVLAVARSIDDLERHRATVAQQCHVRVEVRVLTASEDVAEAARALSWSVVDEPGGTLADLLPAGGLVSVLHPDDWYGASYLEDLASAWQYVEGGAVGKAARFALDGGAPILVTDGDEYHLTTGLNVRRSMLDHEAARHVSLSALLDGRYPVLPEDVRQLALHRFDYCEGGADAGHEALQEASSELDIDTGRSLNQIYDALGEGGASWDEFETTPVLSLDVLPRGVPAKSPVQTTVLPHGLYRVVSQLGSRASQLLMASVDADVDELWPGKVARAGFLATGDLQVSLVVRFHDAAGEVVESRTLGPGVTHEFPVPEQARRVAVGLKVTGGGTGVVRRAVLGPWPFESGARLSKGEALLVTDHYPEYDNLYRNAFVHARLRRYGQAGLDVDVFRLRAGEVLSYHEFEGVEVATGAQEALRETLRTSSHGTILVHFLNPSMWRTLREFQSSHRLVVWVHGAEIQPWWRRAFNYLQQDERDVAEAASVRREAFWRDVFAEAGPNVHFVFVSQFFADQVQEDYAVDLAGRYSVIHNPVDTDIFRFEDKDPTQRLKILSLRPYASRVYANDLSVAAVVELATKPWFEDLELTFIGDGPLFESTLQPLLDLPNVRIQRGYLKHDQIAELYRENGVLLIPTRSDTHGVSRDEAMASGMVPVTSGVAAVPEFLSEEEGYLAPAEDHRALAAAIEDLYLHPETFVRKSRASAARVRAQAAADNVVPREIELIRGEVVREPDEA